MCVGVCVLEAGGRHLSGARNRHTMELEGVRSVAVRRVPLHVCIRQHTSAYVSIREGYKVKQDLLAS